MAERPEEKEIVNDFEARTKDQRKNHTERLHRHSCKRGPQRRPQIPADIGDPDGKSSFPRTNDRHDIGLPGGNVHGG